MRFEKKRGGGDTLSFPDEFVSEISTLSTDVNLTSEDVVNALGYTPLKSDDIMTYTTQTVPSYTNQVPISTDTGGSIYNGTGVKAGYTLSSAGGETANAATYVSGYIPVKKGDVIRIQDPGRTTFDTSLMMALYPSKASATGLGKTVVNIMGNTLYGTGSVSGNVFTWDTSSIGYYLWNDYAWLRVTTFSADMIVTVNESLTASTTQITSLKSNVKVSEENLSFPVATPLLAGKTVVVFGDSIIGMTRDSTSVTAHAQAFTGATVYNVGFGGCRMAVHPTSGYAAFSMWALADAVASGDYSTQETQAASGEDYFTSQLNVLKSIDFSKVDVAVIHYGTNDYAAGVAVNNTSDDDDTSTVCGALTYSIRKLLGAYPNLKIYVSTPLFRTFNIVGAETYQNSLGKKLIEYVNMMASTAQSLCLPVIDGYRELGINILNSGSFLSDGTHLNDRGRGAFGRYIGNKLC